MVSVGRSALEEIQTRLTKMLGLDYRSLSLMRVGLGVIILLDLWVRSMHLMDFYTEDGVLPLPAAFKFQEGRDYIWSIYYMSDNIFFTRLLFVVSAIFAFFLLIGWHTTLFT